MKKSINIAVIAPSSPAEYYGLVWKGIWSAACELASLGVRVQSFPTDGHDAAAQKRVLCDLHSSRPSAIALVPAHVSAIDPEISAHVDNGTPVITFNTDAPKSRRSCFVGTDAGHGGALAAELLGKLMGGRGTVASFTGPPEAQHVSSRYLAFRDQLTQGFPAIREVACHVGFDGLRAAAENILSEWRDLGGIYVGSSRMYVVAEILERLGLKIPAVGFDNTDAVQPYLMRGSVSGIIDESAYKQGYVAVQQAYEAAMGRETDELLRLPSTVVLASNCRAITRDASLNPAFGVRTKLRAYETRLKHANARLLLRSETDDITGLLNRRKFEEILEEQVSKPREMALLVVDLDGFKNTNDHYGHQTGDEVLKAVARILQTSTRNRDYCARMGGDEFCVLLPGANRKKAWEVRGRIVAGLLQTVIARKTLGLTIRASVGIACKPEDAMTAEDLMIHADGAMYADKCSHTRPVATPERMRLTA